MKTQNKFADMKVNEIMSDRVHTLNVNDTLKDALAMMLEHQLTTVPVVDLDHRCVGILSRSDMTELFLEQDGELSNMLDTPLSMQRLYRSLETCDVRNVSELMTYEVVSIEDGKSLTEACQQMTRQRIHHMPVVDENGRLIGIVSTFDVVKAVADIV